MPIHGRKLQMPQPDKKGNSARKEPNWVDVGTLIVLTLTLIAVGLYTHAAYVQSELVKQSIDISSRPLLSARYDRRHNPKIGEKFTYDLYINNLGKSPTKAHTRGIVRYSLERISNTTSLATEKVQLVWPGYGVHETIESSDNLTEGQISDMRAGKGWLYVKAEITYDSFYTIICTEYTIRADPAKLESFIIESVGLCADPKSNDAT
jgi:hypothetical protein